MKGMHRDNQGDPGAAAPGIDDPGAQIDSSKLLNPEGIDPQDLAGTTIEGAPDYTPPSPEAPPAQPDAGIEDPPPVVDPIIEDPAPSDDPYYLKPFEDLKKVYGDDFQVPEGVDETNYLQKLGEEFYKGINLQDILDPELLAIHQNMKQNEISFQDAVKNYREVADIANMAPREILKTDAQEAYNLTEEEASDYVSKMSDIDVKIKAKEVVDRRQNAAVQQQQATIEQNKKAYEIQSQQVNVARKQQVSQALDQFSKLDSVYGIPISEADKREFAAGFEEMVTPNPQTNIAPFAEALQSNEHVASIAFLLMKGNAFGKGALSKAKEATKARMINNLDPQPRKPTSGQAAVEDSNKIDPEKLLQPEGIMLGPAQK